MDRVHTLTDFQQSTDLFSTSNQPNSSIPASGSQWGRRLNENPAMIVETVIPNPSVEDVLEHPDVVGDLELGQAATDMLHSATEVDPKLFVTDQEVQNAEQRDEYLVFSFSKAKQMRDIHFQIRQIYTDMNIAVDALKVQRHQHRKIMNDIDNKIQGLIRKALLKKKILQRRLNAVKIGNLSSKKGLDAE
jgi:hypothetical protein